MKLIGKVQEYFNLIDEIEQNPDKYKLIADQCYFIDDDRVLSKEKKFGNSRYPYIADGMIVWANSSGNITVEESTLQIFPDTTEGKEARLAFFLGVKEEEGYFPISLTGTAKQLYEKGVKRYTLFTTYATYYLTKTRDFQAAVRVFIDEQKRIRFSIAAENVTDETQEIYLSAYFNPLLQTTAVETESKWYKRCKRTEYGYRFDVTEHKNRNSCFERFLSVHRGETGAGMRSTASHADFCGGYNNQLCNAESLKTGTFEGKEYVTFKETAIAGDIEKITLPARGSVTRSYTVRAGLKGEAFEDGLLTTEAIDEALARANADENGRYKRIPPVVFHGVSGADDEAFNRFLKYVFKQTEFCARAKNYAGAYVGIRDIFQQLEASLMWIPEYSRGKILEATRYIGEDGRAPRQYSYPATEKDLPAMDLRPYVDQGEWVISTVYKYLCFTGDYSILEEECGYYRYIGEEIQFSDRKDSVLEHLLAILEYLISKIDPETHCLRALYGDWNDALDGLGRTTKAGKEYGNGVSVMATLHLYQNLGEMQAILSKTGRDAARYAGLAQKVKAGLLTWAVEEADGERKIIHGWGENRAYKIGSFCDNDGESRDSLTSNAFWVLSGAIDWDKSFKENILRAYERLDSKYGLKTFEPYFAKDNKDVGRIVKLPKGTAENGATYVHATLFGIWSLFKMGEAERAWAQLFKILPVTHSFISTSPFVMPNSYIHNEAEGLDGESMSDWFTGSGCVITKTLVQCVFGVTPSLENVTVAPARYFPCDECSIKIKVKGTEISLRYKKSAEKRKFIVNGEEVSGTYDEDLQTEKILLNTFDKSYDITVIG